MSLAPRIVPWQAADGTCLWARVWNRTQPPVGRTILLHGILSHGGWYSATCQRLAESGQEVHFLDRRGSGLNLDGPGDIDGADAWLEDVRGYLAALGGDHPRTLIGLSWGGRIAVAVAARWPELVDRLALVYPGLYSRFEPAPWKRSLLRLAVALGLGRARLALPLADPRLFADDPARQQFIARDPLALRRVTLRFLAAHLELDAAVESSVPMLKQPTLVLLAGRDRMVDNARVRQFVARIPAHEKQVIEYPAAAHTLEFEADRKRYLADLSTFCSR